MKLNSVLGSSHASVARAGAVWALTALAFAGCTTATSSPDGAGGGSNGTGGNTGGAQAGTGGGTGPGSGGSTGTGGGSGGGGAGGTLGTGGGAAAVACPAGTTFCSGFETAGMPAGTTYKVNAAPGDWTRDFALDTTVHNTGATSLRVKPSTDTTTSGSAYKMLAATAPSGKFWVRFYVRSDVELGQMDPAGSDGLHNAFAQAAASDDPNEAVNLEFAQDAGIAFNSHDDVRWPAGYGRLTTGIHAYTLPALTWHCIEISFDSTTRTQMLYANGTQLINVTDYPMVSQVGMPFSVFRFGFLQFHGPPRTMWYDDVAVGPNRMPCL
jgi:hypothetical protein